MSNRVTQSYPPEFRSEAIKLVLEQGFSATAAAARLNMNQGTLAYWVTQARKAGKNIPAVIADVKLTHRAEEKLTHLE